MFVYSFIYLFNSSPKKLNGEFFMLVFLKKAKEHIQKRNKQQEAQTLVAIDIFVKKIISTIMASKKLLDFKVPIVYL